MDFGSTRVVLHRGDITLQQLDVLFFEPDLLIYSSTLEGL